LDEQAGGYRRAGRHAFEEIIVLPGGFERGKKVLEWVIMEGHTVSLTEAQIDIVDEATAGWGHIVVNQIFQSNSPIK
jgi:hypothetical protein